MVTRCASDSARFHLGTSTGWPVQQDALPGTLLAIDKRYRLPIDRSEDGATDADEVEPERQCHRSVAHRYSQIRLRKRRKPVDDGGFDLPDFAQTGGTSR
jgi:beta-glucosidase/6-phospho-beta-glucosidase/beta-galactosidase